MYRLNRILAQIEPKSYRAEINPLSWTLTVTLDSVEYTEDRSISEHPHIPERNFSSSLNWGVHNTVMKTGMENKGCV
jgi:hypothetical protein